MQTKFLQYFFIYLIVGIFSLSTLNSFQRSKVSFKDHSKRVKAITDSIETVENFVIFDSLLARTDTMKYFHLYCLGRDFAQLKPNLSVAVADSMILYSTKDNYSRGIISGYNLLGIIYTYEDNYIRALTNLKKAVSIGLNAEDSEKIKDKYGCTLYYLGDLYFQKKDYEVALNYYKESYKIFDSYTETDMAKEDLNFTLTSYAFTTIREDKAYAMYSVGRSYLELDVVDSASLYLQEALEVATKTTHNRLEARIYYALSRIEFYKNRWVQSRRYSDKSLSLSMNSNLLEYVIYNRLLQMEIKLLQKNYDRMEESYIKLLDLTETMKMRSEQAKTHQLYAEYMKEVGNSKRAYIELEKANAIRKEISNDETARKFGQQEAELKYQQSVYDLELETLKSREEEKRLTIQLYFSFAILILLLIISLLVFKNARKNKKLSKELKATNDKLEFANSKLIDLNDTKTKLFRIISHDLKNPIKEFESGVKHLLKSNKKEKSEIDYYLKELSSSANNIQTLLYSLLNWAESQFSDRPMSISETNIDDAINKVLSLYKSSIDEKNLSVEVDLQVEKLVTDTNILQIILRNVIHNSIKFTPLGGKISISTKSEDDFTILEVTDTGIGMSNEQVEAILNGNYLPTNQSDLFTNTGIGLRAVNDYVNQLGGNLFIESTSNTGTVVTVYFP